MESARSSSSSSSRIHHHQQHSSSIMRSSHSTSTTSCNNNAIPTTTHQQQQDVDSTMTMLQQNVHRDARPILPKAAFFLGDLRDGLPMLNMQAAFLISAKQFSEKQVGLLFLTFGLCQFLCMAPAGYFLDYSNRKINWVIWSSVMTSVLTVLTALTAEYGATNMGYMIFIKVLQGSLTSILPPGFNGITMGIVGSTGFTHQVSRNRMMNHMGTALVVALGSLIAYFHYPHIGSLFVVSPVAALAVWYYLDSIEPAHVDRDAARGLILESPTMNEYEFADDVAACKQQAQQVVAGDVVDSETDSAASSERTRSDLLIQQQQGGRSSRRHRGNNPMVSMHEMNSYTHTTGYVPPPAAHHPPRCESANTTVSDQTIPVSNHNQDNNRMRSTSPAATSSSVTAMSAATEEINTIMNRSRSSSRNNANASPPLHQPQTRDVLSDGLEPPTAAAARTSATATTTTTQAPSTTTTAGQQRLPQQLPPRSGSRIRSSQSQQQQSSDHSSSSRGGGHQRDSNSEEGNVVAATLTTVSVPSDEITAAPTTTTTDNSDNDMGLENKDSIETSQSRKSYGSLPSFNIGWGRQQSSSSSSAGGVQQANDTCTDGSAPQQQPLKSSQLPHAHHHHHNLRARTPLAVLANPTLAIFTTIIFFFHVANSSVLPLVMQSLSLKDPQAGILLSGLCILIAQAFMSLFAKICGDWSPYWGRKSLMLTGLASLTLRCFLLTALVSLESSIETEEGLHILKALILSTQFLDSVGAGIVGTLQILVTADLSGGTGRFSLLLGVTTSAMCLGGTVSGYIGQAVAQDYGYPVAFVSLGIMSLIPFVLYLIAMPETLPDYARPRQPKKRRRRLREILRRLNDHRRSLLQSRIRNPFRRRRQRHHRTKNSADGEVVEADGLMHNKSKSGRSSEEPLAPADPATDSQQHQPAASTIPKVHVELV